MSLDPSLGVIELTEAICNIESVSGNEKALADALEVALTSAAHLEVIRDGDAIVARTNLGRARRVVIAGHIDTVPVADNLPVSRRSVDGVDVLWGRGTVDMKAGVAVQLKLAVELAEPNVDVTWVFYDHEEVAADLNGLGRIARTQPELLAGDCAILGEPSNAAIEGGCNGTLRVILTCTGKRAHSARAWMGENAIHHLAAALSRLSEYRAATVTVDGLDYRESLSAVAVGGGVAGPEGAIDGAGVASFLGDTGACMPGCFANKSPSGSDDPAPLARSAISASKGSATWVGYRSNTKRWS